MKRQSDMQTTTNPQLGLLDSLMIATPTNSFLERLDRTLDWKPTEKALSQSGNLSASVYQESAII